jgi:hypothetical protein
MRTQLFLYLIVHNVLDNSFNRLFILVVKHMLS